MTREETINILKDFIDTYITVHGEEDTIAVSLDNVDVEAFHMAIKALEQEPRWIPVSERLPEKSGNYWCTFGRTNFTGSDYYRTESDAKEIFDDSEEYAGWRSQNVIAWMALPESYKGKSEVKN